MKNQDPGLRVSSIALLLALGGCGTLTQSPYHVPQTANPAHWQHAAESATPNALAPASASSGRWWSEFGDPRLDALIDTVLARNNDLTAAGISVRRAWLEAGVAADAQRPALSANASSSRTQKEGGERTQAHSASLSVSYEVDLWGRLASATDAVQWEARATEQDRDNTAWTLVATTARLYWKLAYLNTRLTLAQQNVDYAQRTLGIARARHSAGAVSGLDVLDAEQTLVSLQATQSTIEQTRAETRNALVILLDAPPADDQYTLPDPADLSTATLPEIGAGLPAELLGRRPDLRAAELRLRATLASGDATRASYYPAITLTGSLGSSSTALSSLLNNPVSTLGVGLVLPFLQWNEMRLKGKIAEADYEKAVVDFRQTLYAAMADVENALSARSQHARQSALLTRSLELARESERRLEVQYRAGAVALKTWLDAQKTRRDAELALAENRYNQLDNRVTLYQVLGGSLSQQDAN
ncbi:MAG: efflux transporter outer membrane subunit [Candidatus Accumulibacter sp.]|nr:efflux transporter outer membrane subunit [Accumulibacter sp.]